MEEPRKQKLEAVLMSEIKLLLGDGKINRETLQPYDSLICNFFDLFSKELYLNEKIKSFPDLATLAFWCRKKNILKLKDSALEDKSRFPLGLLFHISPSNIPTNFAYSLIFGLLCGNSNIVKVPSKDFEQVDIICKTIKIILKNKKFSPLKKMISIIQYSENDSLTKYYSSNCDARIIWGGNSSIKNIKKFEIPVRSKEITFSDRYSFCLIDVDTIINSSCEEIKKLTEKFFNDTYLVDQNACSSPHLILWLGKKNKNHEKAKNIFWKSLYECILNKNYEMPDIAAIDKYTKLCLDIKNLDSILNQKRYGNLIFTVNLKNLKFNVDSFRGKWGYFYQYDISDLDGIKKIVNTNFQTLTYYGIKKEKLIKFIYSNEIHGIDRIVPIGQALAMEIIWDGYDLNKSLTRIIDIK